MKTATIIQFITEAALVTLGIFIIGTLIKKSGIDFDINWSPVLIVYMINLSARVYNRINHD